MTSHELIKVAGFATISEVCLEPSTPSSESSDLDRDTFNAEASRSNPTRYSMEIFIPRPDTGSWSIYTECLPHISVAAVTSSLSAIQQRLARERNILVGSLVTDSTPIFANPQVQQYFSSLDITHYFGYNNSPIS